MAGDSGGGTQRVINETKPDPALSAMRSKLMGYGDQLMKQGVPGYYPGNTVAPFSNQTMAGLNALQSQAQQGAPNLGAANAASARALSGWNPAMPIAQQWALGQNPMLQGITSAAGQNVAGQVAPMIQGASASNPWAAQIANAGASPTTAGIGQLQSFANAENPYLDGLFSRGAEKVANAVNGNFMQAGRYGANAAHTGALTEGLGNLYSSIYAPAYESSQDRALQAASMLPGIQQADRAAAMQGLTQAGGLYESGAARALQGAGLFGDLATGDAGRALTGATAAAGIGLQGADLLAGTYSQANQDAARAQALLPSMYQYGQMPGQAMLDIGSIYEGQAQNYINADRERYDYNANAPWQQLGRYAQLMSGMPDFSGTASTTTGPGTNRVMSGLGGGIAGLGAAQALGLAGPVGWAIGGLGALGGLFG